MNPRKSLVFHLLLLLSLSSFLLRPGCAEGSAEESLDPCGPDNLDDAPQDMTALEVVCRCSPNKTLCIYTAESVSPGLNSTKTNAVNVLKLHVEAARRNAAAAKSSADKLSKDPKTNAATKAILDGCIANYAHAARCFRRADKAGNVAGNLTSAGAQFEKCDGAFKGAKLQAPLTKYTETNRRIVDNYLGIYTKYWRIQSPAMPAPPPKPASPTLEDKLREVLCDRLSKLTIVDAKECASSIHSPGNSYAARLVETNIDKAINATVPALEQINSRTTGDLNKECYHAYHEASGDLVQAKKEIGRNSLRDARKRIISATVNYRKCRSAFVRAHKSTEIPDDQEKLETLGSNTMLIFDAVWPGRGMWMRMSMLAKPNEASFRLFRVLSIFLI